MTLMQDLGGYGEEKLDASHSQWSKGARGGGWWEHWQVRQKQKSTPIPSSIQEITIEEVFFLLQEVQSVWDDDYAANQLLRKKFREQKQDLIAVAMKDKELQKRGALDVNLLPEREEDIEHAHKIRYHGKGVK